MKKKIWGLAVGIILIIVGIVVWLCYIKYSNRQAGNDDLRMQTESVFLSMYSIENFDENVLAECKGISTTFLRDTKKGEELVQILEQILEKNHQITTVFLGIESDETTNEWETALLNIGRSYSDITFEILLSFPDISYWVSLSEDTLEEELAWYQKVCELYSHYEKVKNVHVFMPVCEEWLICNASNYEDDGNVTKEVAEELEKLVFCDYGCIVVPDTIEEKCNLVRKLYQKYQQSEMKYETKSEDIYVFLGDSVIGNYTGSLSIPGVVSSMTGAQVINCGYGGLAAAKGNTDKVGLEDVLNALLSQEKDELLKLENENVKNGIMEFWQKSSEMYEERLVFFLSYGINDYIQGRPVALKEVNQLSYRGALEDAVERLQTAYPKAQIILMTPNYIAISEGGTNIHSEEGAVFTAYVEAVRTLAEEKQISIIDVYQELGITWDNASTYLADGCHPNYLGRFKIGEIVGKSMMQQ